MFMVTIGNAARASNLINMTLADVENASINEEYENARSISSSNYKTSMLYGKKVLMLSEEVYQYLLSYIKYLRPLFVVDIGLPSHKRYVFTSSRTKKGDQYGTVEHSLISNALTTTFKAAGVFDKDKR